MPLTTYTSGEVLTAASLNANLSFAASNPPGGLAFITGASFSAAATVSFAADTFTSTYNNYKVMFTVDSASANANLQFRLRAAGSDNTTSNYNVGGIGRDYAGATTRTQESASDSTGYLLGLLTTQGNKASIDVFSPKLTAMTSTVALITGALSGNALGGFANNIFAATTSFDSMTIYPASGTITGSYKVYGYSNS